MPLCSIKAMVQEMMHDAVANIATKDVWAEKATMSKSPSVKNHKSGISHLTCDLPQGRPDIHTPTMSENQNPETRQAVFHFVDGSQLTLEWPKQVPKGVFALETAVAKAVASQQFTVEADGNLVVIQMANVNFIEVIPAPEKLPDEVIRHGRRVD